MLLHAGTVITRLLHDPRGPLRIASTFSRGGTRPAHAGAARRRAHTHPPPPAPRGAGGAAARRSLASTVSTYTIVYITRVQTHLRPTGDNCGRHPVRHPREAPAGHGCRHGRGSSERVWDEGSRRRCMAQSTTLCPRLLQDVLAQFAELLDLAHRIKAILLFKLLVAGEEQ